MRNPCSYFLIHRGPFLPLRGSHQSPIFVHLRLQLLDVESKHHAPLLKSIYGILLCLPQGDAFRLLNNRLTTVCNLRDNLGLKPILNMQDDETFSTKGTRKPLSLDKLLSRFDDVVELHRMAKERSHRLALQQEQSYFQSSSSARNASASGTNEGQSTSHHHAGPGHARTTNHPSAGGGGSRTTNEANSPQRHSFPAENRIAGQQS